MAEYSLSQKLDALRLIAQEKLQSILCAIPDAKKVLIIDAALIRPLEHVCGASWLRQHGVAKICKFDATQTPHKRSILVYMMAGRLASFQAVLQQIQTIVAHQPAHAAPELQDLKQFHVIAVPTVYHGACEAILEEEGLHGWVQLHRFNWDFLTIDRNVLSLEMPQLFAEVFVCGETALLAAVTQSMRIMQMVFGRPALMLTFGSNSEYVMRLLLETPSSTTNATRSATTSNAKDVQQSADKTADFDAMFIVDRDRDYASCLLQPVTYSALLMELYRGSAGTITTDTETNRIRDGQLPYLRVDAAKETISTNAGEAAATSTSTSTAAAAPTSGHLRMNATHDSIYADMRYRHFSEVVQLLGAQAKQMGGERVQLRDMQLPDMQQYVAERLPKVQALKKELTRHLALCECIVQELGAQFEGVQTAQERMLQNESRKQTLARIEEQLATEPHRWGALRQMCLMHLTFGLQHEEATAFVQNYMNSFGHAAMPGFVRLGEVGLFPNLDAAPKITQKLNTLNILKQSAFQIECGKLKLLPDAQQLHQQQQQQQQATTSSTADDTTSMKSMESIRSNDSNSTTTSITPTGNNSPSYVFNGAYIPVIAQLAHLLLTANRFEEFASRVVHTDQLKLWRYAGRVPETAGRHPAELVADVRSTKLPDLMPLKQRTVWLHMLGGITMAEVAACDLVGRVNGATVVLTSDRVAAGDDFVEAVFG